MDKKPNERDIAEARECAEKIISSVFPSMDRECAMRYIEQAQILIAAYGLQEREKERERCAEIALKAKEDFTDDGEQAWYNNACDDIAEAIEPYSAAEEKKS